MNRGQFQSSSIQQTTNGLNVRVSVYKNPQTGVLTSYSDVVTAESINAEIAQLQEVNTKNDASIAFKQNELTELH